MPKDKRGLHCPCGEELNARMVAESYPMNGGGHRRVRYCGKCGTAVASIEWVVGERTGPLLLVAGLDEGAHNGAQQKQVQAVRAMVESLGGTVTRL